MNYLHTARSVSSRRSWRTVAMLATAALSVVVLAACSTGTGTSTSTSSSKSVKGDKIVFIAGVKGSGFYEAMGCAADAEATKLGYKFSQTAPDTFDATAETPIVQAITAQHPAAAIVVPTDAVAMAGPIQQMQAAGVKVVLADTTVNNQSVGLSRISTDNVELGRQAADQLAKLINDKGTVYVENDKPGASATDDRATGFNEEIKKFPNITNLGTQYYKDDSALAASLVTSELAAHPDLAGIFSEDYRATEGISTGLKTASAAGKVKVVGADGDPQDLSALNSGTVQALIVQKPTQIGQEAIEQLNNALTGSTVTKKISTGTIVATKANMNDPSISKYFYKGC